MLKTITYCAVLVASMVCTAIATFRKGRCKINSEDGAENTSGDNKTTMSSVVNNIPKYIIAAEQLYNGLVGECGKKTGSQKLEYVLDKLKLDCLSCGINFDETEMITKINELIELTKKVN